MKRLRDSKGFTLVELSIVLVIIGIIIGAVLKGQDLMNNAKEKKFINWEKSWEVAEWQYLDRKGKFGGDINKNGIIGDVASDTAVNPVTEITTGANFINPPAASVVFGGSTFDMKVGFDNTNRNVLVICKNPSTANCPTALSTDELHFFEALDTAIDGFADAGSGNARGATTVTVAASAPVTAVGEVTTADTNWAITHVGLAYYFDRPY